MELRATDCARRGVHVALAADDELGALHRAVAPDLGVVAVVADDERHLEPLRPVGDVRLPARVPPLDRAPRQDLAVLLDDLALVVDQHERVVRILLRVVFVLFARQAEDAPRLRLLARRAERVGLGPRDRRRRREHLGLVVHDALRRVLREDDQVHAGQPLLRADDEVADPLDILHHVLLRVEPRHLVLEDADTDSVRRRGDITMARHILLNSLCIRSVRARWRVLERETSGRLGDRSAHTPWIDGRDTHNRLIFIRRDLPKTEGDNHHHGYCVNIGSPYPSGRF